MLQNHTKILAAGLLLIGITGLEMAHGQRYSLPLSGSIQYTGRSANNVNYNAQATLGQYDNNSLNSIAPTINTGGGLATPSLNLNGVKKEGRVPVRFSRQIAVSGGNLGNESVSTIIKHDLTPPRCPEPNEWPLGLAPDTWSPGIIQFRTGDPVICHDQLTEDGTVKNTGAGCLTPGELVQITRHGAEATFPVEDRVQNARSCTTPPAKIDCRPPKLNDLNVQHNGLSLPVETPGSSANPNTFRADGGELNLIVDVEDAAGSSTCGRSGLNWNELQNEAELAQLQRDLSNASGSKSIIELELDVIEADEIIARSNLISNLLSKVGYTYRLQAWKDVITDMNSNSGALRIKMSALMSEVSNIAGTSLNDSQWDRIVSELQKPKYNGLPNRQALIDNLRSVNLEFENNRIRDYASTTDVLINGLDIPSNGLITIDGDITLDESEISQYMDQWSRDILEDYGHVITDWSAFITQNAQDVNEKYDSYLEAKNLADATLTVKAQDIGNFNATDSFSGITNKLKEGLDINRNNVTQTISGINSLNSEISSVLSQVQSGDASNLNVNRLNQLVSNANGVIQNISTIQADVSGNIGKLGKPATSFDYYMGAPFTAKADQTQQALSSFGSIVEDNKTVIQDFQDDKAVLQARIDAEESRIIAAQDSLNDKIDQEVGTLGDELVTLGISHVEIERVATGKKQFFINTDIVPDYGTTFEWNINQYKYEDESYPIFSQAGTYKVTLRIYDYAKNPINPTRTLYILIKPDQADEDMVKSLMTNSCDQDNNYANLNDDCDISFTMKDKFENVIALSSNVEMFASGQKMSGSYDIIESLGENYLNGIRMYPKSKVSVNEDREEFKWQSSADGLENITVRAILPSVEVFPTQTGSAMMNVVQKAWPVTMVSPKVDVRGNVTATKQAFGISIPTKFNPWVFLYLSDRPDNQPPSSPWEVEINTKKCLYTFSTTENATKNLPVNFDVYVKAEADKNLEFYDENLTITDDGYKIPFRSVNGTNEEEVVCFHVRPAGGKTTLEFGFTSKIDYILEGKKIRIPGNPLGLNAGGKCLFPTNPICCGQDGGLPLSDARCTPQPPVDPCAGKTGIDLACCQSPLSPTCDQCPTSGLNCGSSCGGLTGDDLTCCQNPQDPVCSDVPPQFVCPGLTGRALDCCLNPDNEYCVDLPPTCTAQFPTPLEVLCCLEPSNNLCMNVQSPITPGADIEGGVMAENEDFVYIVSDDNELNDQAAFLGGNNDIDAREEATRNAYELTRGLQPLDNTGNTLELDLDLLEDGKVTYIQGGLVVIGRGGNMVNPRSVSGGSHTLIIEEGNLLIAGDLGYDRPDDILGVMMINQRPDPAPTTGNIFVHKDVRSFVGVYFADGSLTTTESLTNPSFAEPIDRFTANGDLDQQLILTGALLTRNTLGASELLDVRNPWGQTVSIEESQKYDLHYVRRYTPIKNNFGIQTNFDKCTELGGGSCYQNKRSFIIRIDPKIGYNPPPGFTVTESSNFQSR